MPRLVVRGREPFRPGYARLAARRRLAVITPEGRRHFDVLIFAPRRGKKGDWSCRIVIDRPEGAKRQRAHGVDSAQALELAFKMIGAILYTSEHHKAGRLMFQEPGQGYGFPVTSNMRDLLVGYDAQYL
jgi:hypothetical protein